ncbi:MAG: hypothetical protein IPK26_12505 [Planctomycetes bacterium]|nr:hypothetical protein [Planctomycetota bacterium]
MVEKLDATYGSVMRYVSLGTVLGRLQRTATERAAKVEELAIKVMRAAAEGKRPSEYDRLVRQHNQAVENSAKAQREAEAKAAERDAVFDTVIQNYNRYIESMRNLRQDRQLLEKLVHDK